MVTTTTTSTSNTTTTTTTNTSLTRKATTSTTALSDIHPDIIQSDILARLDGSALATIRCVSGQLRSLSSQEHLWSQICDSTWPSINTPHLKEVISTFPNEGPISFFSLAFPLIDQHSNPSPSPPSQQTPSELLISAVDIHFRNNIIFSKTTETQTNSTCFKFFPFKIDMLEPKEVSPTGISICGRQEELCQKLYDNLTLSWIVIDPIQKRAVNLSSIKPVSVQRHWLSGGPQLRFANVFASSEEEKVLFQINVTCGLCGEDEKEVYVKDMSLAVEDMDGMLLNGEDSVNILERAFDGRRATRGVQGEAKRRRRYDEYMKMRTAREEIKLKKEWRAEMLCVGFGITIFVSFCYFLCFCLKVKVC